MLRFKAILSIAFLYFLIFQSLCFATIINVPTDYLLIQGALDNANNGDTILVDNGTYPENLYINTKELIIVSQYAFSGDTVDISATILDGTNTSHVIDLNNFAGKIQGFKIINGNDPAGGGILIDASPGTAGDSSIICDNIFMNNENCGIFAWESRALIRNNTFTDNYTDYCGAGVYCYSNDTSTIIGNSLFGNTAEIGGGAISCQDNCNCIIENNLIVNNTVIQQLGGGILLYNYDSSTVTGNILRDNTAPDYAGALYCGLNSFAVIENNTMMNNSANEAGGFGLGSSSNALFSKNIVVQNSGGGVYNVAGEGEIVLSCNDVWNNSDGDQYFDCTPVDDISSDPQFCNSTDNNFGLNTESPCAAANNSCGVLIGAKDITCMEFPLSYIPDLAMGYETGNGVSVFIGDGEGGFGSEQNNYTVICADITAGHFNTDGNLDLAATDLYGNIKIYFGDGSGGMAAQPNLSLMVPVGIASGDFDGDTYVDLAVGDGMNNKVVIYKNSGSGTFSNVGSYSVGAMPTDIHTGLFDNNSSLDLVVVNENDGDISVLLNNGTGGFSNRTDYPVGSGPKQVEVEDFNGDTYLDIAVTNKNDDNISVYFGDGLGGFSGHQQYPVGNEPWGIECGYFSPDNIPDLVVTNHADNDISILINDGTGDFSDRTDYATGPGGSPNDVAVGQLNDDGFYDLVVCHRLSNSMDIMLNNGSNQFPTTSQISCNNFPSVVLLDNFNNDFYVTPPTSYTVTNLDDDGDGSLRWAITEANNHAGQDTILFDISGTIQPLSQLPALTDPDGTIIWGSSAPEKAGSISLDCSISNGGLAISAPGKNNIIEGLTLMNSNLTAIDINSSDSNIIINNHLHDLNYEGILVTSANYNRIGGYEVNEGNIIENAVMYGIYLLGYSDSNFIIGNQISNIMLHTDAYGSGIFIKFGNFNTIDSNIINSNARDGIDIGEVAQFNTISRNLIYNNTRIGIDLGDDSVTLNDVDDADTGPNDLLNYPVLDSIHINDDESYGIFGTAAVLGRVEYFVAEYKIDSTRPQDPSGHGEAYEYIGYTQCDGSGKFADTIPQSYQFTIITMTATDTLGNTSEFSQNSFLVPGPLIILGYTLGGPKVACPSAIDLRVIDPDGNRIGYDVSGTFFDEIPDAGYFETAGCDDSVYITNPLIGTYNVEVVAETGAFSRTTYAVGIRIDGSDETMLVVNRDLPPADSTDSYNYEVEAEWHYTNGDANRDSTINIFDITFIISYLYLEGESPWPVNAADANCDLVINIFDITYLINYLYREGDEPCYTGE